MNKYQYSRLKAIVATAIVVLFSVVLTIGTNSNGIEINNFKPAEIDTSKINVILNGNEVGFDVNPAIVNGRTMVPLRAIMEALNLDVEWISETRSIVAHNQTTNIKLSIGSKLAYVNNVAYTLDSAPVIMGGRTLVPVRFLSESMAMDVQWNAFASVVFINSKSSYVTKTYDDGKTSYIGQVDASGNRCGFGTSYAEDGSTIYVGQWLSDEEFGIGTYTWKRQISYQGECKDGEAWGYGKMVFPETGYYTGYFKDQKRNGIGTFTWYVGDKYVGNWENDKMNGQGTYTFFDGYSINGNWDNNAIKVQSMSFSNSSLNLGIGDKAQIVASFLPLVATEEIIWTSSNEKVLRVSGEDNLGKISALSTGTATITASTKSGKICTCKVIVSPKIITADTIALNQGDYSMLFGESMSLKAAITPSNTTDKTVTWSTSDSNVATVDGNGKVNAISSGTAIISATTTNGRTATCYITVTDTHDELWSGTWTAYSSNSSGAKGSKVTTYMIDTYNMSFSVGNSNTSTYSLSKTNDYELTCTFSNGSYDYEYTFTHISDNYVILEINTITRSSYVPETTATSYYVLNRH